jgi:hypothetical protein
MWGLGPTLYKHNYKKKMFCYIWPGVVRAGPVAGGQGAEAGAEGAGSATAHTQAQQSLRQVSH